MTLSIIIVNYNVRDLLLAAIASLGDALEGIESEIIVVDNASTDGAVEVLQRDYPEIITIPLPRNLGFGAANNVGIERARGGFILLLNPDTIVQDDTIRTMLDFMAEHPEATFAGCKIILPDGSLDPVSKRGFPSPWSSFCRVFGLSRLFPRSRFFGGYNLTWLDPDTTSEIDALAGCFMFCRADALKALGGFDTDFFMYGEDLDLCYRAKKAGGRVYYHPATSILHRKGESTRRSSMDALHEFYRAMEIFARKHFRSNVLMLWLVRAGIRLRRTIARTVERYPGLSFMLVDIPAVLLGFTIGSLIKFGTPFYYPDWALAAVWTLPPLIFVVAQFVAGGYTLDDRTPARAAFGFLLLFFVLSTLPYFFKDYAFSRGVVLVTTGTAAVIGVAVRFAVLLYRRTFGPDAIRRVAVLAGGAVGQHERAAVRRLFLPRPAVTVGTVTPNFRHAPSAEQPIGAIENLGHVARAHRITDVVAVDTALRYSDVLAAMKKVEGLPIRFHVLHSSEMAEDMPALSSMIHRGRRANSGIARGVRDRLLALALVPLLLILYLIAPSTRRYLAGLPSVVLGRRSLVGTGSSVLYGRTAPLFSLSDVLPPEDRTPAELERLEERYRESGTLLDDCDIIVTVLRHRADAERASAVVKPRPSRAA